MATPVFEIHTDQLAHAYGDVALQVYPGEIVAVTGVDDEQFVDFDRRILSRVSYSFETVTDYGARDVPGGLVDENVSIGRSLMSPGWQKMLTGDAQRAQRLADLMRTLNVTVDHRAGLSVLAEKKIQLAVAAANTQNCLLLDNPPRTLTLPERRGYWQAVAMVAKQRALSMLIRTSDIDALTKALTRLIMIKDEHIVVDAPMRRIRQRIKRAGLIRIDRSRLTVERQEALFSFFPNCELTGSELQILVDNLEQAQRRLKRANLSADSFTVEAGQLSHFITQSLLKNDFQLYWLNQRLNL